MGTSPLAAPPALTPANLVRPKERTYFAFALTFSLLVWLILTVTVVGLVYALILAVILRLPEMPRCPFGGTYQFWTNRDEGTAAVSCSRHGSVAELQRLRHLPAR